MKLRRTAGRGWALLAGLAGVLACSDAPADPISLLPSAPDSIACEDVFELKLAGVLLPGTPYLDGRVEAEFTGPDGAATRVIGFPTGADEWRVRYRPPASGTWTYGYFAQRGDEMVAEGSGTFTCNGPPFGRVQTYAANPHRWLTPAGRLWFPLGLQTCMRVVGDRLESHRIDGENRGEPAREVTWPEYFELYGDAGFNLLRFSQHNCSFALLEGMGQYNELEAQLTDEILALANEHGTRVMFGFFGFHPDRSRTSLPERLWRSLAGSPAGGRAGYWTYGDARMVAAEKRFVTYAVARWGVYVDFWELLNELTPGDAWLETMVAHLHDIDPERRPVSTSWPRPDHASIDIVSPHWYESEDEHDSDLRVAQQARRWKEAGKPVIVGEQGNTGMNWDPRSAVRMRLRLWAALFSDIGVVLWETTGSKNSMFGGRFNEGSEAANIYIGPQERQYTRVLQAFASRLDGGMRMVDMQTAHPGLRTYGLRSERQLAVYFRHHADHAAPAIGASIDVDVPGAEGGSLPAEWIDPATGAVLARLAVEPGRRTLAVPSFRIDIALLIGEPADSGTAVAHPRGTIGHPRTGSPDT